ncbi:flagellar basal body rod protein FlgB [Paraburkholderia sp. DHOC27]|uniref:flagellar basal body rod protein FlgB n=1 Tax=Paraburkholderia sp. DHOC27 TaxID=2303330 RepID=UPI000E3DF9C5|nr:flagellar basal body rod protein FlgB [Paraburkholderia sp. DHOC27]RFU47581.1 flagellar basal body rod protein FlgB [Paraburkholderia sp. DHOC27]
MLDKLDAEFAFGRQALDVRSYRQELLSSNIANADTPGYKARDVDFGSALAGALKQAGGRTLSTVSGDDADSGVSVSIGSGASNSSTLAMAQPAGVTSGMTMASTEPGHMSGKVSLIPTGGPSDDYGQLAYRIPTQPSLDGNTVDLDAERVQFADNSLHFESTMTEVSNQIKSMLSAITSGS